jgi:4-amino-4-deoxy-L-arabinose transferase-like glycosyltransferase
MIGGAAPPALRRFLVVLLLLYCARQVAAAFVLPPFSGHDEVAHFEYIRVLAGEHRIPTLSTDTMPADLYRYKQFAIGWTSESSSPLYTAVHPPLYYALMVPVYGAVAHLQPEAALDVLRCAAIPFGALVVLLSFLLTRAMFPRDVFLAVTVPAVVAFQPQVSYLAAIVNNDIVAIACYTWLLYLLVRVMRDGASAPAALLVGCVAGLGILTKATALAAVVLIPPAFWIGRGERGTRAALIHTALAFGVMLAMAAPWWWFMTRTYGDPLALSALARIQPEYTRTGTTVLDLLFSGSFFAERWSETWGEFGWRLVHIGGAIPVSMAVVTGAAIAGLVREAAAPGVLQRINRTRLSALALLAATCVLAYAAMAQFGVRFLLTQARYAFQAIAPAALLAMVGLRAWIRPAWRTRAQVAIVGALISVYALVYIGFALPFWYGAHVSGARLWRAITLKLPAVGPEGAVTWMVGGAILVALASCVLLLALAARVEGESTPAAAAGVRSDLRRLRTALESSDARSRGRLCAAAGIALAIFAAWQMGAFLPQTRYGVVDTFASFDHPFHVARAVELLRSLHHGENLRWIANHQGGYPAEFYPFGFAWFEVALWALGLGRFAMPAIHKFAVIALFLAPGLLFAFMARKDRWPPFVALAAFVLHVAVPGGMWQGGYGELVYMGLVSNVSAALMVVVSMAAAVQAFSSGGRRALAVSALAAGAAIWCNPRSALGLVVCAGAAAVVAVLRTRASFRRVSFALAGIAAIAALLAAPELTSLARYRTLYYFIRYTSYASALDYLGASLEAISIPAFLCALAGCVAALAVSRERVVTKTTALALGLYVVTTLVFSFGATALVQQLETTRLMPVQRLLMEYLAAVGLYAITRAAAARMDRSWLAPALQAAVVAGVLVVYLGPFHLMSFWNTGLFEVDRSTAPQTAILQQVLDRADHAAPQGTAILVVGSDVSTHEPLWAPVRLDRLFFYDSWMWYWHAKHRGPYNARKETIYDWDYLYEIFEREYLDRNAIGAVVVNPDGQASADSSPELTREFGGDYGLYTVNDPTPVVTLAGGRHPDALQISNHRITAEGTSGGGEAFVRRNWFPRWQAAVNGRAVPIVQTADGYMTVPVPPGRVRLTLTYALLPVDLAARIAAAIGGAIVLALIAPGRIPRWAPFVRRRSRSAHALGSQAS